MDRGTCPLLLTVMLLTVAMGAERTSPQISFSGRVLDGRGRPVPDANVVLYEVEYGGAGVMPTAERIKGLTTGPDGVFVLTMPRDPEDYRAGSIIARKEGLALGWAVWEMREGDRQADITLSEPKELAGTVVDEGDSPVVDADVSIALAIIGRQEDHRYLTYYVAPQLLTVKTDSAGRFVFSNMPGAATFEFLARKSGRGTTCSFDPSSFRGEKCQFSPGQTGIKLTLPAEARIEGKVVEKTSGKPLGGVQLIAQSDQRGLAFTIEPVTSAQDGTFFVGNLAPGGYTVQLASRAEGLAEWVAEPVAVPLKTGETVRDISLALTKGGVLEVVVKDEADRTPIEKAGISIRSMVSGQWFSGRTDAAGVARIRLAPGDYEVRNPYKQGYMQPQQSETITIAEGETKRFEQTLAGLPSVTGVVLGDAGKPLEGATVRIVPSGRDDVTSDAQGQFKASWDPRNWSQEGMVFYIVARHPQRNLAVAVPMEETGGSRVEVKLQPGVIVAGLVVDPNGKGIEGATIRMMLRAERWGSTFMAYRSIKTDAQGRYEVPAIPSGRRYNINASAEGYGQAEVDLEAQEVQGERVQAGTCTLAVADLSVSGVVVDSEGKPVPSASVSCYGDGQSGQPDRNTRTDAQGRFTLTSVCPGRIRIQANGQVAGVYNHGMIETDGGATDIQITVSVRSSSPRYVPRKPAALKGKPLPDLKKLGIELPGETDGKALLVCFWDMNQRPSRHCISDLIRQVAQMEGKGVTIVGIHAGQAEEGALEQWLEKNKPPFPVGRLAGDFEKGRLDWGAASLPHLILTDRKHIVIAEGFGLLEELDERIEAIPAQPLEQRQ